MRSEEEENRKYIEQTHITKTRLLIKSQRKDVQINNKDSLFQEIPVDFKLAERVAKNSKSQVLERHQYQGNISSYRKTLR